MDFNHTHADDIVANAIRVLEAVVKAAGEPETKKRTDHHEAGSHDAIRDMCRRYCDAHECHTCKINKMIEDGGHTAIARPFYLGEDWCVIRMIADSSQPTEAMLTEVMRFDKEGDPKPRTFAEDYFSRYPEAIHLAIEKNGVRMPHVCRVSEYDGIDTCPGGMTCWECWQKPMER